MPWISKNRYSELLACEEDSKEYYKWSEKRCIEMNELTIRARKAEARLKFIIRETENWCENSRLVQFVDETGKGWSVFRRHSKTHVASYIETIGDGCRLANACAAIDAAMAEEGKRK